MSFELFVQCNGRTEQTGLSRDPVGALFPVKNPIRVAGRCATGRRIGATFLWGQKAGVSHFMVSRPGADRRLGDALLTVLGMGDVTMFWPGSPPMIAITEGATRLPEDMVKSLAEPALISPAEQFFELLKTAWKS